LLPVLYVPWSVPLIFLGSCVFGTSSLRDREPLLFLLRFRTLCWFIDPPTWLSRLTLFASPFLQPSTDKHRYSVILLFFFLLDPTKISLNTRALRKPFSSPLTFSAHLFSRYCSLFRSQTLKYDYSLYYPPPLLFDSPLCSVWKLTRASA